MRSLLQIIIVLLACLAACWSAQAATINVPADQPTIQAGIDAAGAGDTVLVADGTYYENIDFLGKAITVTSVNGPASATIDGGGLDWVVTFQSQEGRDSLIEGFTITNGTGGVYCLGDYPHTLKTSPTIRGNAITGNTAANGAGICCYYSDALIEQNSITSNISSGYAGGLYLSASNVVLRQNDISGNSANVVSGGGAGGGGIRSNASNPQIDRNTISGNSATWGGGGIEVDGGLPLIVGNEISGNTCVGDGGGIYIAAAPNAEIRDNEISGNSTENCGGGIYAEDLYPLHILGNRITGNDATDGGGVCTQYREATIANNLIAENTATNNGGGLQLGNSEVELLNNTIIYNHADHFGGGVFNTIGINVALVNNILFFNTAVDPAVKEYFGTTSQFSYCDVEGGQSSVTVNPPGALTWGAGMIDADPLFVTGPLGEAYLSQTAAGQPANSPCRDAGSDFAWDVGYDTNLGTFNMDQMTTRSDQIADTWMVDLGWHHPGWPLATISTSFSSQPTTGNLPFSVQFSASLRNRYLAQTRRIAVKVDADLAGGTHYSNWRSGWTNVGRGVRFWANWPQYFPALGTLVGVNQFSLSAADVTPAPFNQPPYPPSGDTDTNSCTVTAFVP